MAIDAKDALTGLDEIDWAALQHAHGPAGDVPAQLRALRGKPEARRKALQELYGNVFHEGSRYEASAPAVPFLARLAADPSQPDRHEILALLASLAIGSDQEHLPGGVDVAGWRHDVATLRATDATAVRSELDTWVERAPDEEEHRARDRWRATFDLEAQLRSDEVELRAYDAVRREVSGLCGLLHDRDPSVRAAAAHLLAWFPEEAAHTLPGLLRLLDHEALPAVAATALVAAGLLGDAALAGRLKPFLAAEEHTVRWAAATALVRVRGMDVETAVGAVALGELAAAEAEAPEPGPPEFRSTRAVCAAMPRPVSRS